MFPSLLLFVKNSTLSSIPFNSVSIIKYLSCHWASQVVLVLKNLPSNAGDIRDMDSIPGLGRSPREGRGSPFQYSCLENPMDRAASWAKVHGVAKYQKWLKPLSMYRQGSPVTCFNPEPLVLLKKSRTRGFPDGPMVRILHFHCRGPRFIPGWGIQIL